MKTLGLIGGMSWESTALYYRFINEAVRAHLGGLHSARLLMHSVDFAEIERLQKQGQWSEAAHMLATIAQGLQAGGAELLLLCTNTMHKVAQDIQDAVSIPLLHIADPTADAISAQGLKTVGLLGTRFTMEQAFYADRLRARGLNVVLPQAQEQAEVHRIIFEELCQGQTRPSSRAFYRSVMAGMVQGGAQGIILGCTEISLLVNPADATVPLFDTAALNAQGAVAWALA